MADTSDVEHALVVAVQTQLVATPLGIPFSVSRGWPTGPIAREIIDNGSGLITVFPVGSRDGTIFWPRPIVIPPPAPSMAVSVSGATVTFSGVPASGQFVSVNAAYSIPVSSGQTLSQVAQSVAAEVPGASAGGSSVTMPPGMIPLTVVVVQSAPVVREIGRYDGLMRITIWAPVPPASVSSNASLYRDQAGALVDQAILSGNWRFPLPDGTVATLWRGFRYSYDDRPQQSGILRRDQHYTVQFPVTTTENTPPLAAVDIISTT